MLSKQYDDVCCWIDWAHRDSTVDTGIDLVAHDRINDSWTAIQCEFCEPDHYLQKSDIDSFFTASGETYDGVGLANKVIISTTDKWSSHAENALSDQVIPVQRIGVAEISAPPIDWAFALPGTLDIQLKPASRFSTRPHQDEGHQQNPARLRDPWPGPVDLGVRDGQDVHVAQACGANGQSQRRLAASVVPGAVDPVGGPDAAGVDRPDGDGSPTLCGVLGHQGLPHGRGHLSP